MHSCGSNGGYGGGQGTAVLVFQPGEEGSAGARKMVQEGALDKVEAIFGLHVSGAHPLGTVAARPGPFMAASGFFKAHITGRGGHAANPHNAIDPVLAASAAVLSLQHLVSREAPPPDSQVPTHLSTLFISMLLSPGILSKEVLIGRVS